MCAKAFKLKSLIWVVLLLSNTNLAASKELVASMEESLWEVHQGNEICSMTHEIPNYGTAIISKESGELANFKIISFNRPKDARKDAVTLSFNNTPWQRAKVPEAKIKLNLNRSNTVIFAKYDVAQKIINNLLQGMQPTFHHKDWLTGVGELDVGLSPINFNTAYAKYIKCLHTIPEQAFYEINTATVHFGADSYFLSHEAKKELEKIAAYVQRVGNVELVKLSGYSDSFGPELKNKKMANLRASEVKEYLKSLGVDESLLRLYIFGDRDPVADNKTKEGRAKNRRVEITLER